MSSKSLNRVAIMKEVDSFIAQAKLEGEISSSSSSSYESIKIVQNNSSLSVIDNICFNTNKCPQGIAEDRIDALTSLRDKISSSVTNNINMEPDISSNEINNEISQKSTASSNSPINICSIKEENSKHVSSNNSFEKDSVSFIEKSKSWTKGGLNEDREKNNCSYVDLSLVSTVSQKPYVMWLQERRSERNMCHNSELNEKLKMDLRGEALTHSLNSALFWERWIDRIFQLYDHWVYDSSDSDDNFNTSIGSEGNFKTADKQLPTRTRSEPALGKKNDKVENMSTYESSSYTNGLLKRRQEDLLHSYSDNAIIETKEKTSYWTSLYGHLTKSISSIFVSEPKIKTEAFNQGKEESSSIVHKSPQKTKVKMMHSNVQASNHKPGCLKKIKTRSKNLKRDSSEFFLQSNEWIKLEGNTSSDSSELSDYETEEDIRRLSKHKRKIIKNTLRSYSQNDVY